MKSAKEILEMLVEELAVHLHDDDSLPETGGYYNEGLGKTSFLLSGLLQALLKDECSSSWNSNLLWIDDSLITTVTRQENKLRIGGAMIWGKRGSSEEWVDPFFFEIEPFVNAPVASRLILLFGDDKSNLTYEEYKDDPTRLKLKVPDWKYRLRFEDACFQD